MINIVMDTNIYKKNPSRDNLYFKALSKLSKRKEITIFLPEIVEKEFQSQQRELRKELIDKLSHSISQVLKTNLLIQNNKQLKEIQDEIKQKYEILLKESEIALNRWIDLTLTIRVGLDIEQTNNAWEAYFNGDFPFHKPRESKKQIPDVFIAKAIEQILKNVDKLYFIAEDSKLREYFKENNKIQTFASLDGFINSKSIQSLLKKIDYIESNIEKIKQAIIIHEKSKLELRRYIECNLGDEIIGKEIEDHRIPEDNNTATIESFNEPDMVDIDLDNMFYYGDGLFGFSFEVKMDVFVYYCIYKSDYYSLNSEYEHVPGSISDWSDHYYEANDECEIKVRGAIGVTIDLKDIPQDKIDSNLIFEDIHIDDIEDIEFIKW